MDLHTSADKPLNHPLQHEMLSPTFRWSELNDEQIASSIEATPIQDRAQLWGKIPDDRKSGVFLVMPSSVRQHLSETITQSELNSLVEPFDAKELTAIKRSLSDEQLDIFVDKHDEHQHKLWNVHEITLTFLLITI